MMRATPTLMAAAASRVRPLICSQSNHHPKMTATSGQTNA